MNIDPFEVPRCALTDFGEDVTTPAGVRRMLLDEEVDDTTLGMSRGGMSATVFRCLPDVAAELAEENVLTTTDGLRWLIFEMIPHRNDLTEIRVNQL
ncbi:MAG: hypothetical protein J7K75_08480 [Desulfuromonas sp.]|nr:hypothetical protein [Desulfuromonas sp.]